MADAAQEAQLSAEEEALLSQPASDAATRAGSAGVDEDEGSAAASSRTADSKKRKRDEDGSSSAKSKSDADKGARKSKSARTNESSSAGGAAKPDEASEAEEDDEGEDGDAGMEDVEPEPRWKPKHMLTEAEKAKRSAEAARQAAEIKAEQARSKRARLRYLLGQSDLFRHFLEGGGKPKDASDAAALFSSPNRNAKATGGADSGGAASGAASASASAAASTSLQRASSVASTASAGKSKHRHDDAADGAGGGKAKGKGKGKAKGGAGGAGGEEDAYATDSDGEEEEDGPRPGTRLLVKPACITADMRDYQLEGLNWMISLHENGINGILADEMGLGKTLQTISLVGWAYEALGNEGPHLVLVPKSTLANWQKEFKKWCPALQTCVFHGTKEERDAVVRSRLIPGSTAEERGWHVLLSTYEVACRETPALLKIPWQYLIIDEAHRIKNEKSSLAMVVRSLTTAHRLLITGTPLQNNLHELWALLNFLLPDVFGSSEAFDSWFDFAADTKDEEAKANTVKQLHRVLRPFMLRRLKKDVATSLPPKKETLLYVGMTAMQRKLYRGLLVRDMDSVLAEKRGGGDKTRLSNLIMHLRKACAHPYLFPGFEDRTLPALGEHLVENCAKLKLLDRLLPRLKERGSRVLLFSQMTSVLDILEDYCTLRGYSICRIDGQKGYDEREEAIEAFNADGSPHFLFLLSTRAGGLGINLATADVVILYDSDWNPQADLQAQDRAHRIGQKKPVQVYRLVTAGTVEEKIIERAMMKLKLDAVVVQQGRLAAASSKSGSTNALSKEDMIAMVQFGADAVFRAGANGEDGGAGGVDADVTEQDVDAILALGEAKTRDMNAAVNKKLGITEGSGGGLLNFKLDAGSAQTFEGVDYSDLAARKRELERLRATGADLKKAMASSMASQAPTERAARQNLTYNEKEVYRALLAAENEGGGGSSKAKDRSEAQRLRALLPASHRPPPRMDSYQLLDKQRINAITAMEIAHIQAKLEREKAAGGSGGSGGSGGAAAADEEADAAFPADLIAERAALLSAGFPSWRKEDTDAFVSACRKHGRRNLDAICAAVGQRGRPAEEIRAYAAAFWERGERVFPEAQWNSMMRRIERGEKRGEEIEVLCVSLAARVARMAPHDPWRDLPLAYTAASTSATWTEEADRFLLMTVLRLGHGRYEDVRHAVQLEPRFRFDWWFRSRTAEELESRARRLLRLADKDLQDYFRREDKAAADRTEAVTDVDRKRAKAAETASKTYKLLVDTAYHDVAQAAEAEEKERQRKAAASGAKKAASASAASAASGASGAGASASGAVEPGSLLAMLSGKAGKEGEDGKGKGSRKREAKEDEDVIRIPPRLVPALADMLKSAGGTGVDTIADKFCDAHKGPDGAAAGEKEDGKDKDGKEAKPLVVKRQVKLAVEALAERASKTAAAAASGAASAASSSSATAASAAVKPTGAFVWQLRPESARWVGLSAEAAEAEWAKEPLRIHPDSKLKSGGKDGKDKDGKDGAAKAVSGAGAASASPAAPASSAADKMEDVADK